MTKCVEPHFKQHSENKYSAAKTAFQTSVVQKARSGHFYPQVDDETAKTILANKVVGSDPLMSLANGLGKVDDIAIFDYQLRLDKARRAGLEFCFASKDLASI